MASARLEYKVPPQPETVRRVYALPIELVERVHSYGFDNGHQSEVSAVRELLEMALSRHTFREAKP